MAVSFRTQAGVIPDVLVLLQAKILRMSYDPDGAIKVLQDGLAPGRTHTFAQADGLVSIAYLDEAISCEG